MSSTSNTHNKKCFCNEYKNNQEGYSLVQRQTAQCHNKRARYEAFERNTSVQSSSMEVDIETFLFQETGPSKILVGQTNSPFWEANIMSDNDDMTIDNEVIDNADYDNNTDNNKEKSKEVEEVEKVEDNVEIEVEEFNNEDPFATPNMSENLVHRFIATFVIMFASRYVVNKGAVVLIEFINKLLTIYKQDFQLPLSLPGLQRMTGFSTMNKGVQRFLMCQDCHKVYEESALAPSHCDFIKLGVVFQFLKAFFLYYIWLLECIYCLTSVGVTIMTSSHKSALGLPTKLAPYRSDTVYPALYRLGYFDLVCGTIIDPMHNLFLGTAKRMIEKWIKENDISPADLATMQKMSESMALPANYTILRSKIGKGFLYMKADEWKS
ncbi:hypothetical protein PHYBLDRAFT_174515 [Phycomyces blakesleeanus NRRL 1555(-)]|uniref:Uncharacterized protein n=1 Tax=Phycomyces blakesleeanus (strain ATCC 8743b / DSM 1359 / FGSC 10004 / NBRC 33097 / NRRL 1555) TaxID=763407 RepID=A0A162ZIY8_PHYB8|nr:hypothetical protein PHYBLDRAFT_174515 [Phycomyces blakesleeanus NRRL 1555(-)]OAD67131.1 hypothetical protein PHYBLDRAFT_174515 [Phycomyces blakesleeanus NRRL 1555(-)]|eukprot:XP_018285171.1 hypothetical protein PHYBLDRAFT_174515 [Phycomyces blakesleeanus NRRL 1555(-)]